MSYSMNPETGNLNSRTNNIRSLTETFTYDNLDRLINAQVGTTNYPVSYLTNGNIDEKFDAGEYAYDNSNHAVTDITGTGSAIPTNTQSITYNSFNKPTSVSQGYRNSQFKYSPDMQRCVMKTYNTQVFPAVWIDTRYYLGNYEELVVKGLKSSKKYHYIYSPDGLAAIYYTYGTTTAMYYAAKDHLGSICMLIDQNRSVVDERSFDAWGRNRNPVNWTYSSVPAMLITNRGYTTHEHLADYGIVNMNGRLYDPIVGRMMNADPFIADFSSSQNYNRYSYVNNNPLKYTDPSGYMAGGGPNRMDKRRYRQGRTWFGGDGWNLFGADIFEYTGFDVSWAEEFDFLGPASLEVFSAPGSMPNQSTMIGGGSSIPELPEITIPIPKFVLQFPSMVDFRRGLKKIFNLKGKTHVLPWIWGIRKASIPLNFGWNYNVTEYSNAHEPFFDYNNSDWFRMNVSWADNPGIIVTGFINGIPANAYHRIRHDGIALDSFGRPVIGFNATYNNGASISLRFNEETVYNISITTRSRRKINIPFYYLDLGLGLWGLIFSY